MEYLPALLAFSIAAAVTGLEYFTSTFPRTFFLLCRSRAFFAYIAVYGLIAAGAVLLLDHLVSSGIISFEELRIANPWLQAAIVGVTVKALLHIRIFNLQAGQQTFPIGIETLTLLFEPWLLRTIEVEHFNALRAYIEPRAAQFDDPGTVRLTMIANLPSTFPSEERAAMQLDLEERETVIELMELYLGQLGRETFERVFGEDTAPAAMPAEEEGE